MLAGGLEANTEGQINLPEHAVEEFGRVVVYLYSGDFPVQDPKKLEGEGEVLTKMYLAGQKYELDGLKTLTLNKIEKTIDPVGHSEQFLTVAQALSASVPESDTTLHNFLKRTFGKLLGVDGHYTTAMSLGKAVDAKLQLIVRQGGQLALDLYQTQCSLDASKASAAKAASTKDKRDIQLFSTNAEEWQERSEAWQEHHEDSHSDRCNFWPNGQGIYRED